VKHMKAQYPDRDNVNRLVERFNPKRITETLPTSKYTAYSENKGEKMAFCVTKKKNGQNLIDENTLTFVALHELSHLMTKSIGHDATFWRNFKYLIEHAVKLNLYTPEDYKKKSTEDINKFFEIKFAGVLRDLGENNIPTNSTIGQKASNLFGAATYGLSENINLSYDFAIDNDFNTFEQNEINLNLNFNKISSNFTFTENDGKMGDTNIIGNSTTLNFDEDNSLTFATRRNRKINFTEYYDLVYEYKNDCLVAGLKYKKSYYEDRDLKPKEDLFFTITIFPLSQYEQKIDESVYRGEN